LLPAFIIVFPVYLQNTDCFIIIIHLQPNKELRFRWLKPEITLYWQNDHHGDIWCNKARKTFFILKPDFASPPQPELVDRGASLQGREGGHSDLDWHGRMPFTLILARVILRSVRCLDATKDLGVGKVGCHSIIYE